MSDYPWIILTRLHGKELTFELPGRGIVKVELDIMTETKIHPGHSKRDPASTTHRETIRDIKVLFQKM